MMLHAVLPAACIAMFAYVAFMQPSIPSASLVAVGVVGYVLICYNNGPARIRDHVIMSVFLAVTVLMCLIVNYVLVIPAVVLLGYAWIRMRTVRVIPRLNTALGS